MGRIRTGNAYSSRIIDIDVLFYETLIIESPTLVIPHPRLNDRKFVLKPLSEIAPGLIHPVLRKTVVEMLSLTPDSSQVQTVVGKAEFGELLETITML
jgi:2-amino-4-hydroxy-6-hydroxymethyldihydropteridine diphosphokinase